MKCKSTLNLRARRTKNGIFKTVLLLCACAMTALSAQANAAPNEADAAAMVAQANQSVTIKGRIVDESGNPVIGANVILRSNQTIGISADVKGEYTLRVPSLAGEAIVVSALGKTPVTINLQAGKTTYDVRLSGSVDIETVKVVETGIFQRDQISFTGSAQTFTGEELKIVGNSNVLQSLRTLDPSFLVIENLEMGSDPNTMMNIEIRGSGAATLNAIKDEFTTDPNTPLFVLDGIEVGIQSIVDLDMNRVESLTVLKDAGSTAIYGSKGANGVVVIETIKPKEGEYRVYYTADIGIEAPDLDVYNMMNASEKLRFEELSGKYRMVNSSGSINAEQQKVLHDLYRDRLKNIQNGVDTYWLNEPVRTGFSHGHSVRITGGTNELSMTVGAKYKKQDGVMKGSDRESWGGNIGLTYRKNGLIITNSLEVSGVDSPNSPYGSFQTWVNTSPYYRKRNDEGNIEKWLAKQEDYMYTTSGNQKWYGVSMIANPLWNASIGNESYSKSHTIRNGFNAQYKVNNLILKAGLNMTKDFSKSVNYKSPDHTDYYSTSNSEKGSYTRNNTDRFNYQAFMNATYSYTLLEDHIFTGNLRVEMREDKGESSGYTAIGFKNSSKAAPNYGMYPDGGKPSFTLRHNRSASLLGALNYNYKNRYFADFQYRYEGASTFGSNKVFKPFWSVGAGWNINREEFAKDWTWTRLLKLRATYGITGNQNIGSVISQNTYQDYADAGIFGPGIYLSQYANPNLPWQISKELTIGTDVQLLDGRMSLTFDFYTKKVDPLIQNIPVSLSTGIGTWAEELGYRQSRGVDGILSFSPIYRPQEGIVFTIRMTGAYTKSWYDGLGDRVNEIGDESSMRRLADGESPDAIWAVKSAGIDPATGREVYIRKDGVYTFNYPTDDQVVVGDTRPSVEGVIGPQLRYKNLTVALNFRYSWGADVYNNALFNKVENISFSTIDRNQDKRALYNRWQKPGDVARYRSIEITDAAARRTSRFVQKNNYLKAESISVGYELTKNPWLKRNLGAETLKISLYTNDVYQWRTSKIERGTEYPFARSFSMSLGLTF